MYYRPRNWVRVSRTTKQQRRGLRYASICSIKTREQIDGLGCLDLYASIPSNSHSILGLFNLFVTYFVILLTRFLGQMTLFRVYTRGISGNGRGGYISYIGTTTYFI